jgi:WD40 repeat protein
VLATYGRFYDYKVRLWDTKTGQLLHELPQDALRTISTGGSIDNQGVGLALSADAKTLVTAKLRSDEVVLRESATGREIRKIETGARIECLALSPDDRILAATCTKAEFGDTVGLWVVDTGKLLAILPKEGVHKKIPTDLMFSPDGKTLVELCEGTLRLWNVATRKQTRQFTRPEPLVKATFTPKGRVWVLTGRPQFDLWDVQEERRLQHFPVDRTRFANDAAFSPDGKLLAAAMGDGTIELWTIGID